MQNRPMIGASAEEELSLAGFGRTQMGLGCGKISDGKAQRDLFDQIFEALISQRLDGTLSNLASAHETITSIIFKLDETFGRELATTALSRTTGHFCPHGPDLISDSSEKCRQPKCGMDPAQFLQISRAMLETVQNVTHDLKSSRREAETLKMQLDEARNEADHDLLTGLPNRRCFERQFIRRYQEACERQTKLHLALCDVDHFKQINDTFGHATGDDLLRAIAGILCQPASVDCFVARYGGEEFALLFSGADMKVTFDTLEAARQELETRNFVARRKNSPIGTVTFSAGVVDVMASASPKEASVLADEALYKAKGEGRNRILIAETHREAATHCHPEPGNTG